MGYLVLMLYGDNWRRLARSVRAVFASAILFLYTGAAGCFVGLSTCADLSCASDKLCSFSAENSELNNLTQPGAHA